MEFTRQIDLIKNAFIASSERVKGERWQGVDVSRKPEMEMHELRHRMMRVPLLTEDLSMYRQDIRPNLPWADDHFAERVCGQPINPGIQWAKWPWGNSAANFREMDDPFLNEQHWAYLAAMIDADGCILIREERQQVSLIVDQVDHPFVHFLKDTYKLGQELREQNINNKLSDRVQLRWQISARDEVKWVLSHIMPYLVLKKNDAVRAFNLLPDFDKRLVGEKGRDPIFNHNYMQRYWPKHAGMTPGGRVDPEAIDRYRLLPHRGIYHRYGDLMDVVAQLQREPHTRQAILPVFFPEDTGAVHGGRVPCTMYYHFIMRNQRMDIVYAIRSCDFVRHLRDDIYLTIRLLLWMIDRLRECDEKWNDVRPGEFVMMITSLHMFRNDFIKLSGGR